MVQRVVLVTALLAIMITAFQRCKSLTMRRIRFYRTFPNMKLEEDRRVEFREKKSINLAPAASSPSTSGSAKGSDGAKCPFPHEIFTGKVASSSKPSESTIPGTLPTEIYTSNLDLVKKDGSNSVEEWEGYMNGFDWQLEQARRLLEGPGFAPIRMTLWEPILAIENLPRPGPIDAIRILLNNALSMMGLAESLDGAPVVQIVNNSKGSILQLISRIFDGDLAQLAGGPLFLLLQEYYKQYGPVFKLAFGPKSFIVISDPAMVKHILKDNPLKYDKGILAEILAPVMGKGLIPADPETWKVRRKAIVPGFHKAWLNAMVSGCHSHLINLLRALVLISVCLRFPP